MGRPLFSEGYLKAEAERAQQDIRRTMESLGDLDPASKRNNTVGFASDSSTSTSERDSEEEDQDGPIVNERFLDPHSPHARAVRLTALTRPLTSMARSYVYELPHEVLDIAHAFEEVVHDGVLSIRVLRRRIVHPNHFFGDCDHTTTPTTSSSSTSRTTSTNTTEEGEKVEMEMIGFCHRRLTTEERLALENGSGLSSLPSHTTSSSQAGGGRERPPAAFFVSLLPDSTISSTDQTSEHTVATVIGPSLTV